MNERLNPEEHNKMVDKLQKLLALATSPNENEARLAMDKAAELMEKYSLSMADVNENGNSKPDHIREQMTREDIPGLGSRKVNWESLLANSIAMAFDAKLVTMPYATWKDGEKRDWSLSFLGFKADVEMAIWLHLYIRRSISRLSSKGYKDINGRNNFAHGMVSSVHGRLQEMYKRRNEISDCKALVVVKTDAVKKFTTEHFPSLKKGTRTQITGDRSAYYNGIEEGKKLNLSRPLNGSGSSGRSAIDSGQKKLT
jgi:hypothetical protein